MNELNHLQPIVTVDVVLLTLIDGKLCTALVFFPSIAYLVRFCTIV